jgi:3-hydroxy-D-aspartate aldolase
MPKVRGVAGAEVLALSEEHGWVLLPGPDKLQPGDKVRLVPGHGCTTINLHDRYYVVREGWVEDVWPVAARGRSQ